MGTRETDSATALADIAPCARHRRGGAGPAAPISRFPDRRKAGRCDAETPPANDNDKRTVLVIASRFPPATGPGALRISKMVRYLPDSGWRPVVLTVAPPSSAGAVTNDASAWVEPVVAATIAERLAPLTPLIRAVSRLTSPLGRGTDWWYRGLKWRVERLEERLSMPDPGVWRLRRAVRAAQRLHRRWRFDAIYSTGMPFSDHLIAWAVQRAIRRPWIAEFRDPWVEYAHAPAWRAGWRRRAARLMERAVVRRARCIVSVSEEMTARFRERYPAVARDRFVTIENGFDPTDFERALNDDHGSCGPTEPRAADCLAECFTPGRFTLFHAGSFYAGRRPEVLVRAFRRFASTDESRRCGALLVLCGRMGEHAARLAELAHGLPVVVHDPLPHEQVLACMTRASANVLVMADGPGTEGDASTKLYEYLGAARPILALAPARGAAARLLRSFPGAWCVPPDDEDGALAAMEAIFRRVRLGEADVPTDRTRLRRWTRQAQAGRLAEVLDAVACNAFAARMSGIEASG